MSLSAVGSDVIRSVALICASVHVAGMNIPHSLTGQQVIYGPDYVVNVAKKFEAYLWGEAEKHP